MIFLPNSFERYIASLRFYIHLSIAKHGLQHKHFEMLKKINVCEALYFADEAVPTDIIKLSNSLLGTCVIIMLQHGKKLAVSFRGDGTYFINKRLYTVLIMSIIKKCSNNNCEIIVTVKNDNLILKIYGLRDMTGIKNIINALHGCYYRECTSKTVIINIPVTKTSKQSEKIENEWYYLIDKFSPVNIFLNNYPNDNKK